jgi:hypothetical protein
MGAPMVETIIASPRLAPAALAAAGHQPPI